MIKKDNVIPEGRKEVAIWECFFSAFIYFCRAIEKQKERAII